MSIRFFMLRCSKKGKKDTAKSGKKAAGKAPTEVKKEEEDATMVPATEQSYQEKVNEIISFKWVSSDVLWSGENIAWRSDIMLWGSWITPDTGHAAAMLSPKIQLWPWLVVSARASKRDVRSWAQRIQWNPLNGAPGACLYPR